MFASAYRIFRNPRLQKYRRLHQMKSYKLCGLQAALPAVTCVDVGASYYPHTSWWVFLDSPRTNWIDVEPNSQNLDYVEQWPWAASVTTVTNGLSRYGGEQVLYVTNIDSGSSLLPPIVAPSMEQRTSERVRNYFFPVREVVIQTQTLAQVVSQSIDQPIVVKLDTQGSELDILKSLVDDGVAHNVVGVEIECSLLATPYYQNSPRLWDVARHLESNGFEALDIDVFPRIANRVKLSRTPRRIVNECDAVFALRPDVLSERPVEFRVTILGFYLTNNFYEEAALLLSSDAHVDLYLRDRGCDSIRLLAEIRSRMNSRK